MDLPRNKVLSFCQKYIQEQGEKTEVKHILLKYDIQGNTLLLRSKEGVFFVVRVEAAKKGVGIWFSHTETTFHILPQLFLLPNIVIL